MRVAILANNAHSFVLPMAQGLQRMFSQIHVESAIFYEGLWMLNSTYQKQIQHNSSANSKVAHFIKDIRLYRFIKRLRQFDIIVIVSYLPFAFMRSFMNDTFVRNLLHDIPLVLYDVVYLPTRGAWKNWLKEGNPEQGVFDGGHYGLERYDWYLCASVVSEHALPQKGPQPYSLIGLHLDDGTLFPEKHDEFIALLDFERAGPLFHSMKERAIQILALENTQTPYIVLNGQYSIQSIREIYRKCSLYFLASHESFGLPICELQLCGSYIVTPYSDWIPSHWMKKDVHIAGPGELSPNFIVYHNDEELLMKEITRIKAEYNAPHVVQTFQTFQPHFAYGDRKELQIFADMVKSGKIHSKSHLTYRD